MALTTEEDKAASNERAEKKLIGDKMKKMMMMKKIMISKKPNATKKPNNIVIAWNHTHTLLYRNNNHMMAALIVPIGKSKTVWVIHV